MKINIPASSSIFLLISYYFSDFQIFLSQRSSIIISNYLFSTVFFQSNQIPANDRNVTQQINPYTNIFVFSFARGTLEIIVPVHSAPIIVVYYTEISLAPNYITEHGIQVLRWAWSYFRSLNAEARDRLAVSVFATLEASYMQLYKKFSENSWVVFHTTQKRR